MEELREDDEVIMEFEVRNSACIMIHVDLL